MSQLSPFAELETKAQNGSCQTAGRPEAAGEACVCPSTTSPVLSVPSGPSPTQHGLHLRPRGLVCRQINGAQLATLAGRSQESSVPPLRASHTHLCLGSGEGPALEDQLTDSLVWEECAE